MAKANILLVDDHPSNLLALRVVLEDLGYNLIEANSGNQALQCLQANEFALALIDVKMPDIDGFETAKRVRAQAKFRHLPIIFMTGYDADEATLTEAYALGAVDYLVKPFIPQILRAKVKELVQFYNDRRRAEREAAQLRLIIESTADYAIFMLDTGGNIITWNAGAQRIKGYKALEIIGKHFSVFYTPEELARELPKTELVGATERGRFEDEGWRVRKDGSQFWANVVITAMRDRDGKLLGFSKITRDLSERKKAEESLREAHAELESRVLLRTNELALANKALKEADRRKDDFLAMLSHELRNPLAPVRNALQILKMPGLGDDTRTQTRDMIERQVNHLVRLVDDLLDVSRIMRNKIELRKEHVDLAHVFAQAVEMAHPIIESQGQQLSVKLPARRLCVNADLVRMTQVVTNLLTNAAKYSDQAGQIELIAEREGNEAVVRVRDTGFGIPPELLPRIFDLFVQADRSLARSQGGLGIGLTLVRRLVEMHGGSVSAASAGPDQGSEFVLRIPALSENSQDEKNLADKPPGTGPPRRVLVVDDNVDAAVSAAMLLRFLGHEVDIAYDGYSALAKVREFQPEIVLLDIGLPGMNGHDVARTLRAQPEFKGLVLAAVTGYGQEEDRRRSLDAGFDFHLTKPLAQTALTAVFTSARPDGAILS
jgi:PAS domain S-box-containing protein